MNNRLFLIPLLIISFALTFSVSAGDKKMIKIVKPFAKVYEYLDPESRIICHAQNGDYFPLVYAGTAWFQIRVQDKVGWLERQNGTIVEDKGIRILSMSLPQFILVLLLLGGTVLTAFYYINKQQKSG